MNLKSRSSLALILPLLLTLAGCSLSVYNLQALGSKNDPALLNISYSIANFGFAPYLPSYLDTERQLLLN